MKVLFIGDIFSEPGRRIVKEYIPLIKEKYQVDIVIVNGENSAHGKGITAKIYEELLDANVDVITTGNHFLAAREKKEFFDEADVLLRPFNIHNEAWGVGTKVFKIKNFRFRVTNLLGRIFLQELNPSNPFDSLKEIIDSSEEMIHIVDFHAEATAEKYALAYKFDGQVSAIIGTHTHVQTADERILPRGTGYISDVGMTGPFHSIIGGDLQNGIFKSETGLPVKLEVAEGESQLSAVILDIDDSNYRCRQIIRLYLTPDNSYRY